MMAERIWHHFYDEGVPLEIEPPEEPLFTQQETLTEEEVIAHCKEKLVVYKVPRLVEFR
jgi:acyl-CoA synthetase (AMP-forming)/AMP-acid ligase II